jgi:hypothetical protein
VYYSCERCGSVPSTRCNAVLRRVAVCGTVASGLDAALKCYAAVNGVVMGLV